MRFFERRVARGRPGEPGATRPASSWSARLNVCVADDGRPPATSCDRGSCEASTAQRPDFFTFRTAGLTLPAALREASARAAVHARSGAVAGAGPEVPDAFVDAVTLCGPPGPMAAGVVRLARSGIGQVMVYPLGLDGRIEGTIERFQTEVMPHVRRDLERS